MRKKLFAMYALAGALVASPVFTSCVDDTVSSSVEALRDAKAESLLAEAAYDRASAEALMIKTNAEAALTQANAAYKAAEAAWKEADAKAKELETKLKEATYDADLAAALAEADSAKLAAEQALAIAKINAEKALEMAKWKAQQDYWAAEKTQAQAQANYEKFIAGLANEDKRQAENINGNINAILNGGYYYGWNTNGVWSQMKYYDPSYNITNTYNSIMTLTEAIPTEKINLIKLQNGLVDLEEYIAEEKEKNDETIATQTALIKKYTELMGTSSREALTKEYEAAEEALEEIGAILPEKAVELYKAKLATTELEYAFAENAIQKLIEDESEYLTEAEAEKYIDTLVNVVGETTPYEEEYSPVYEHTALNAETLAADVTAKEAEIAEKEAKIAEKQEEIAAKEAEIAQVNVTDDQRELAILEAAYAKDKEAYDKILASEGYKKYMADLEKAVADAQAAFDKEPTEDNKTALETAEDALEAADYEYEEGKLLSTYTQSIENQESDIETLKETIDEALGNLDTELEGLNEELEGLNEELEGLNEELEGLNEIQAMLAADSKEMKAYLELCKQRAELEKAYFILEAENKELELNQEYWEGLMTSLEAFIDEDGENTLPDYEDLIANCEKAIKEAERANAALAETVNAEAGEFATIEGDNKAAQEALIAKKEAEIAAMEAELETRQAEYDAEVAALKALVAGTEE